jgi:hypothetical protein
MGALCVRMLKAGQVSETPLPDRKDYGLYEAAYQRDLNSIRAENYRTLRRQEYMSVSRSISVSNHQRWGKERASAVERA